MTPQDCADHLSESVERYFQECKKSILFITNWDLITAKNCIASIKEDIIYSGLEKEFSNFLEYLDTHVQDVELELNQWKRTVSPDLSHPKKKRNDQSKTSVSFRIETSHERYINEESHRLGISPSDYLNQTLDMVRKLNTPSELLDILNEKKNELKKEMKDIKLPLDRLDKLFVQMLAGFLDQDWNIQDQDSYVLSEYTDLTEDD